ncbi:MAG TPA: phosphatidylglycerophosphatase A [Gemmatimonadota bacterium]|nr:phosphatidylglycerophosphatase A [Gemmatimonadota bacterium]
MAVWVATLGPVGYWPLGPGTLASALVAGLWWALPVRGWAWLLAVIVLIPLGIACADRAEAVLGHDDGRIVIDEVLGMGTALLTAPHTAVGVVAAFVLFRTLDIGKPPPLGRLQRVRGGSGVVLDDLAAGALAAALVGVGYGVIG